jgi:probable addiction module antidote protein
MKTIPFEDWFYKGLENPEEAAAYLEAAMEDDDPRIFLLALRDVTLAQGGIQFLAQKTGLHRVNLNRILSARGNPEMKSLTTIMRELGFHLGVTPIAKPVTKKGVKNEANKAAKKGTNKDMKRGTKSKVGALRKTRGKAVA